MENTKFEKPVKTRLLVAQLEVISDQMSDDCRREILREAAERLADLDTIATYFHSKANKRLRKRVDKKVVV